MGFLDALIGRPQMKLLPGIQNSISSINGLDFSDLGYGGRQAKHILKDLNAGKDTSNLGYYAPLRQEEAADLATIDEDYSTGANVLNAAGGGEQANQINAMRDRAKENRRAQTGRQIVGAMGDLRRSATDTFTHAHDMRDENLLRQQQLLLQARGNQYNATPSGGFLGSLISGGAQVGGAFLGKPCWIAKVIFGDDDPRVDLIRNYLLDWEKRSLAGAFVVWLYRRYGERVAKRKRMVRCLTPLFNRWLRQAMKSWNRNSRINGTYSIAITAYRQPMNAVSSHSHAGRITIK